MTRAILTMMLNMKASERNPVMGFRAPTPAHKEEVEMVAAAAGLTCSEWIRRAVKSGLEEAKEQLCIDQQEGVRHDQRQEPSLG